MNLSLLFRAATPGTHAARRWGAALLLWLVAAAGAQAQVDSLGTVTRQFARYTKQGPQEKLFLHLDRPLYLSGETLWFKVYAIDVTTAQPLPLSSVAYVEVLTTQNQPVLQGKIALDNARGSGSFELPASLPSGTYTVRAYTSWMRNFGPETYYHGTVTIINTTAASAPAPHPDSLAVDAQFFPEGGNLVSGLPSKVGFKITDRTGKGLNLSGSILNKAGQPVAQFRAHQLGMGNCTFTPTQAAGPYTAVLVMGPNQRITRKLPPVYSQGYVLAVQNASATHLALTVRATSTQPERIYLVGHSQQKLAVAVQGQLVNGQASFEVSKDQLLEGISHFTLFNANQQPVCERLYFKRPQHQLPLTARLDKPQYATREKVAVQLQAGRLSQPASATSLSMAVYRLDSLSAVPTVDIDRYFWLTSDLRGHIENPDYYFTAPDSVAAEAADNLMLTQGWSRFRWEDVLQPKPLPHLAEPNGLVIRGQLRQAGTGQPLPGVMTFLSSPSRLIRLSNSQSSANGLLQFEVPQFYGSRELVIQTNPRQDSTAHIALFNPFAEQYASSRSAPFALSARFAAEYAQRHFQQQVQAAFVNRTRARLTWPAVDSVAFYGKASETYLLDKYTRFQVLEEVLREYVPGVVVRIRKDGFHFLVADRINKMLLQENPLVMLDGVPVFNINKIMAINPLKIQKLEVVASRYIHGLAIYDGIVSFTTYKGDLEGFQLDPRVLIQEYEGLQQHREFYAPRYASEQEKRSRLPDLRNLLYWNPELTTTGAAPTAVSFYTGDQPGHYLMVVQGLSAGGNLGSTRVVFEVKPAL